MAKTTKTTDITPVKDDVTKKVKVISEFYSVKTRQYHPMTTRFVEQEIIALREWADLETSLLVSDFTYHRGYAPKTFYEWCKKFPELKEMHDYANSRIASRREIGAMTGKYKESTVHRTLGHYSPIWKEETEALARLKDDNVSENQFVVIERFASESHDRTEEEQLRFDAQPLKSPEQVAAQVLRTTKKTDGCHNKVPRYRRNI